MQILNDSEARFNSADLNIAYKMNVDEYQRLCPYSKALEENWGKAPGGGPCIVTRSVVSCSAQPTPPLLFLSIDFAKACLLLFGHMLSTSVGHLCGLFLPASL